MSPQERWAYERHRDDVVIEEDVMNTSREEGYYDGRIDGLEEGRAEGLEEGRAEGRIEGLEEGKVQGRAEGLAESKIIMAKRMLDMGYSIKDISEVTRLSVDEINSL